MKTVIVTQRLEKYTSHNEIRQNLDIKMTEFIHACGFLPVLIPYNCSIHTFIKTINPSGLILSGGNTLSALNPHDELSILRDKFETSIFKFCKDAQIPILGICRGMQFILSYYNIKLEKIQNHVGTTHEINIHKNALLANFLENSYDVNSYHNYGTKEFKHDKLETVARCVDDNSIEAIQHKIRSIFGIMWHPERSEFYDDNIVKFVKKIFE